MIDRAHIGRSWPAWEVDIEKGRLRVLARAIGENRPIYVDEGAARAAGYRSILAPLTLPFCLLMDDPNGLGYLADLGIPVGRMLHAEERVVPHGPICAGDRVRVQRRVRDMYSKKNGTLDFVVFGFEVRRADTGDLLAESESTLVVRHD